MTSQDVRFSRSHGFAEQTVADRTGQIGRSTGRSRQGLEAASPFGPLALCLEGNPRQCSSSGMERVSMMVNKDRNLFDGKAGRQ